MGIRTFEIVVKTQDLHELMKIKEMSQIISTFLFKFIQKYLIFSEFRYLMSKFPICHAFALCMKSIKVYNRFVLVFLSTVPSNVLYVYFRTNFCLKKRSPCIVAKSL